MLKQISNILNISVLFIVVLGSTLIHQQVYALKQYVNNEYNISLNIQMNGNQNHYHLKQQLLELNMIRYL